MERYLLFSWDTYYPNGGLNDLAGDYSDCLSALAAADDVHSDDPFYGTQMIVDVERDEVIMRYSDFDNKLGEWKKAKKHPLYGWRQEGAYD